ncbi:hypothetical protein FIBSPDRAFT_859151 [Athelia psychrophila]|uniref:Uncharacterized protein n=1 Tax=Athelia psychrophila TaxID=1759441 RepID=A0A166LGU2_9AGAM|nr:hypothetical protein FIBSPDRAFT_859151 [Fibularhizoctonia sp. CBS 109695]
MIGPTSSYYDPEQAAPQDSADYQRWVDAYGNGTVAYDDHHPANLAQAQFQQHQRQLRPQQMQNQYQFVPNQYNPAPTSDHHFRPTQGVSPQDPRSPSSEYPPPVSGRQTGIQSYPQSTQPIDSNMYFYPPSSMGSSQPAYAAYPGAQPTQQQQHLPAYTSPTIASDLHSLPIHQSVSPPWSEERLPPAQMLSQRGPSTARIQRTTIPSSKTTTAKQQQPPGSAKKSTAGRKRPRKSGGDDSESESDEDPSIDARGGDGQQGSTRL